MTRIYNLHYRQSWWDGALTMKLGQQAADDDFMLSEYSGLFTNSCFGAMPTQAATALAENRCGTPAFAVFAVAAPGLSIAWQADETWSFQTGAYVGSPGADESGNHGFDWSIDSDDDAVLGAFWRAGLSPPGDRSVVSFHQDCGLVWNGAFGRSDDSLGLAFSQTRMGDAFRKANGTARDEWTIELTWRCQVAEWMAVQGGVQWIIEPAFSEVSGGDDQALVFGLRSEFAF